MGRLQPPRPSCRICFDKEKDIPCKCMFPTPESGRIPVILEAMRTMKKEVGGDTALYGLICGPLTPRLTTCAAATFFKDMRKDPDYVVQLTSFCAEYAQKMADLYIEAGMDVIAVVGPACQPGISEGICQTYARAV